MKDKEFEQLKKQLFDVSMKSCDKESCNKIATKIHKEDGIRFFCDDCYKLVEIAHNR